MAFVSSTQRSGTMSEHLRRDSVSLRISDAEARRDWGEVSDILDHATREDIMAIRPIIPHLATHREWIIRASTVEAIGASHLRSYASLIKERLDDTHVVVRAYALMAYYDLLGRKALPLIYDLCASREVSIRVTALSLRYVHTGDRDAFNALRKLLTRKGCSPYHRSAVMRIVDYYCGAQVSDEMIHLFEEVLPDVPPKVLGLAEDMRKKLAKWRHE
jgi:hypothetical protein